MPIFGVGSGHKCNRVILGNSLIAIVMLKHDLIAGLVVPVDLLLLGARTRPPLASVVYQLPSGLIAGTNNDPELLSATRKRDEKLEVFVQYIAS